MEIGETLEVTTPMGSIGRTPYVLVEVESLTGYANEYCLPRSGVVMLTP